MKLRISAKLASVHSEVNVTDLEEKTVFTTKTDPLSAPRCTRTVLTQRAWSSRFEVHSEDGKVLVRAKQVPALRGDVYDIEVLDEDHVIEMVLLALIARSVIRDDAPIPV